MSSTNPQELKPEVKSSGSPYGSMYSIFHMIAAIFALYLSFRCNEGFNAGGFLFACCCPYIYIIYEFATSPTFCGIRS
jgi:amino acid permease